MVTSWLSRVRLAVCAGFIAVEPTVPAGKKFLVAVARD